MTDHYEMDDNSPDAGEKDESSMTSAVLPKSILAGKSFDVGDILEVRVDAIGDDEITVSYNYGDKEQSPQEDNPEEEQQEEQPQENSHY